MEDKKLKVRIKTWEEMAEEFGMLGITGVISTEFSYTKEMELQIPKDRVIEVEESGRNMYSWNSEGTSWLLSGQEFAEILGENLEDIADSQAEITPCVETGKSEIEKIAESLGQIKSDNMRLFKYLSKQDQTNNTHYVKYTLKFDENLSIRYYHQFDDKPHFKNKWVLKNHKTKLSEEVTEKTAMMFVKEFCETEYEEIIGLKTNKGYRKIKVGKNSIIKEFE